MTIIILAIILMGYFLIATGKFTHINKSAVAIFIGTVGWVLYVCYGSDFVEGQHLMEYKAFLHGMVHTSLTVKQFIAQNIFLKHVAQAAETVLFLLATMAIVEILQNNGCLDFLLPLMRTRNSKRLLWIVSAVTFVISVNLDSLTTTLIMLTTLHRLLQSRKQRMLYGAIVVVAANCGGTLTVIGDPTSLVLWNSGFVTATKFSLALIAPCLTAWFTATLLLSYRLPENVDIGCTSLPYRGDDTNLNVWQRLLMLMVGIGGLWFIPTFHNITRLSPFLGALCVLSLLWIVNELVNRKLFKAGYNMRNISPHIFQYSNIQMMLFVMGVLLTMGVLTETGIAHYASSLIFSHLKNVWMIGSFAGILSLVLDNFMSAMTMITLGNGANGITDSLPNAYAQNGVYWQIVAFTSAMGGSTLCIGSMSGLAYMKAERVRVGWYFRNVGYGCLAGTLLGLVLMWLMVSF